MGCEIDIPNAAFDLRFIGITETFQKILISICFQNGNEHYTKTERTKQFYYIQIENLYTTIGTLV